MKHYTPLVIKALNIAYTAHHGQFDKSGAPFIYHAAHVAARMDTEDEIITALLHNVVQKSRVTFEDLEAGGFPKTVTDALHMLTPKPRRDDVDFIFLKYNRLAVKVKLAALYHDSDPSRLCLLPPEEAEKAREKCERDIQWLRKNMEEEAEFLRRVEKGDPESMLILGIWHYRGFEYAFPPDRRKAFDLISRAIDKGLPREQSDEDYPGYEYGELCAACYMIEMLLRDDDGVVSARRSPFLFEKPWDEATDVERIFMCITGRGGVEQNLKKAYNMAVNIYNHLSFSHDINENAERMASLLYHALTEDTAPDDN